MNPAKLFLLCGSAFAGLGVILGAFGAHALRKFLDPAMLSAWQTGVLYQMIHALALIVLAILVRDTPDKMFVYAGYCLITGILLFSGSLYLLSTTGLRIFGPVTPIGGIAFIVGWILFFTASLRSELF